jgi:hypothetical protein
MPDSTLRNDHYINNHQGRPMTHPAGKTALVTGAAFTTFTIDGGDNA